MTEETPVGPVLISPDCPGVRVALMDRIARISAGFAATLHWAAWTIICRPGTRPNQPRRDGCPRMGEGRFPAKTIGALAHFSFWLWSPFWRKVLKGPSTPTEFRCDCHFHTKVQAEAASDATSLWASLRPVLSEELRLPNDRVPELLAGMNQRSVLRYFKPSPGIICLAVMLCIRFPLS
jgi:hypothetical protein